MRPEPFDCPPGREIEGWFDVVEIDLDGVIAALDENTTAAYGLKLALAQMAHEVGRRPFGEATRLELAEKVARNLRALTARTPHNPSQTDRRHT